MPRTGLLLLLTLVAACGCASLDGFSGLNPFGPEHVTADAKNPAVEVACIWQPGEGTNEKGIPARGFSGQVFFFTRTSPEPVLVDGTVRVYLFADRGTPEERGRPIKQFDFMPEAWKLHATMTSLGPGYGVFIPYPQSEPYQVRCQLRARFIPKEGPTLWSEAVTITLEGPPQPGAEPAWWSNVDKSQSPPTVIDAKVTHETKSAEQIAASQGEASAPRRLRTDTFRLGEIQQAAYEAPAREAPAPGRAETPVDEASAAEDLGIDPALLRDLMKQQARGRSDRKRSHPLETAPQDDVPAAHPLRQRPTAKSPAPHPLAADGSETEREATKESGRPFEGIRLGQGRSFARPEHPLSRRPAWKPLGSSLPPIQIPGDAGPPAVDHAPAGANVRSADDTSSPGYGVWHPLAG